MDHSVPPDERWSRRRRKPAALRTLLHGWRFENDELERLYRRYIFKEQHTAVVQTLAVFAALTAILAALTLTFVALGSSSNSSPVTFRGLYFSIQSIIFIILLTLLLWRTRSETLLPRIVYGGLLTSLTAFVMAALPVNYDEFLSTFLPFFTFERSYKFSGVEGVWEVALVTFTAYTMLPLKTYACLLFGVSASTCQLLAAAFSSQLFREFLWQQVRCKCQMLVKN